VDDNSGNDNYSVELSHGERVYEGTKRLKRRRRQSIGRGCPKCGYKSDARPVGVGPRAYPVILTWTASSPVNCDARCCIIIVFW